MRRINAIHQLQNLPNCAGERSGAIQLLQIVGSGHLADGVVGILRKAAGEEDRQAGYLPKKAVAAPPVWGITTSNTARRSACGPSAAKT